MCFPLFPVACFSGIRVLVNESYQKDFFFSQFIKDTVVV